jgi:hypothetical protein
MSNGQQPFRPRVPLVPGPRGTHAAPAPAQQGPFGIGDAHGPVQAERQPPLRGQVGYIAGAIAKVMSEVGTIKKGGRNEYFGYDYARMEDLLQAVTPLMGKYGLAVVQNEVEIKQVENRVAVTYEFTLMHESGQVFPEKPRFTGICLARDRKGNWDDKAINKCHTAARKYFLLSLFQVPAGDFDDADVEPPDANLRKVPGPSRTAESTPADAMAPSPQAKPEKPAENGMPHKILLGQGHGADEWAAAYIRAIGKARSEEEIREWDKHNDPILQMLSDQHGQIYDRIATAVERRLTDVGAPSHAMPNPKPDPTEAMNWVASQLQQLNSLEAAQAFWNETVAPHESSFDVTDWEMLLGEWQRTEIRLAPPSPETA